MTSKRKRICILGSTGSIGEKTLQVVRDYPDHFEIVGLCANKSTVALAEQIREFQPDAACLCGDGAQPGETNSTHLFSGSEGVLHLLETCDPDMVVVAMVGAAGLLPTLRAIEMGKTIALANKEVLVTAGELTMNLARKHGVSILPIDSEHNAIFQCLQGQNAKAVRKIVLTGSGGPFRGWTKTELENATLEAALKHPTWNMGRKITIDSATLMNKGFEVIEAHHLFGLSVDQVDVVIHPQSVIHSMVEFIDGSILAQLGVTDMYFPIVNILAYPERLENTHFEALNLTQLGKLSFEDFDPGAFPCLGYAREAARLGNTYPAVLNAANEVAVERFLGGELRFLEIAEAIDAALQSHTPSKNPGLEEIRAADAWARQKAAEKLSRAQLDINPATR